MDKSSFFWTDVEQARERIQESIVCYEGQPVYIDRIEMDDDTPKGYITFLTGQKDQKRQRKRLDSPKFNKFRDLPKLGWGNFEPTGNLPLNVATFVERIPRVSRTHGLSGHNTTLTKASFGRDCSMYLEGRGNVFDIYTQSGFFKMHNNIYPDIRKCFHSLKPMSSLAISNVFALIKDESGIVWLFRNMDRIGIMQKEDKLLLISKYSFYLEQLMENEALQVNEVLEI